MPPEEPEATPRRLNCRAPRADLKIYAPDYEFFPKWIMGLLVPLGIAVYGVTCIVRRVAEYSGEHTTMTVHGLNAIAVGLSFLAAALLLHCRLFWGTMYESIWFVELAEIIAGIVFIASLVVLIIRVGVYGIA